MNFDYSKRGYLLPEGCKDLIDVIKHEAESGFMVIARVPEQFRRDILFFGTVEGRSLRIVGKHSSHVRFQSVIEVPHGYRLAQAVATYDQGELRIVVPKGEA
jgi:HSP20 family molecular chaperone IbpA